MLGWELSTTSALHAVHRFRQAGGRNFRNQLRILRKAKIEATRLCWASPAGLPPILRSAQQFWAHRPACPAFDFDRPGLPTNLFWSVLASTITWAVMGPVRDLGLVLLLSAVASGLPHAHADVPSAHELGGGPSFERVHVIAVIAPTRADSPRQRETVCKCHAYIE